MSKHGYKIEDYSQNTFLHDSGYQGDKWRRKYSSCKRNHLTRARYSYRRLKEAMVQFHANLWRYPWHGSPDTVETSVIATGLFYVRPASSAVEVETARLCTDRRP